MTCLVRVALCTAYGSVTLDPFALAVMPGIHDVAMPRNLTLELSGPDVYVGPAECVWQLKVTIG